ncbi:MAG TPA: hypothetical protein VEI57_18355 [Nitrospirota bacterium]|nr:hypothetical protein [Nitrospirota bacterium]
MKKYLIESPHTKEECLRALDEVLAKGPEILKKFNYGCVAGDHTGYALVDVRDEKEARDLVPSFLLGKARIIEVAPFTPEVIRSLHTKAA